MPKYGAGKVLWRVLQDCENETNDAEDGTQDG